jgi:hypothetical protein
VTVNINRRDMTSDLTPHTARRAPAAGPQGWEVSWLPADRRLNRDQAVTAMLLAEICEPTQPVDRNQMEPFIQGWSVELDLSADQAENRIAAPPAWTVPAQPTFDLSNPEAGE